MDITPCTETMSSSCLHELIIFRYILAESISDFRSAALIGGLKYPLACVGCGILYNLGALLYMAGYKDTKLNVKVARLKKGGPIQFLSHLVVLGIATKTCISLL
mmetsp:Transcript_12377/g.18000  ORF Transcript_12377/g.18000 Transcript_12377/m.18000 type:complete len:104 (+) Transcript_12377:319-630(+)